VSTHDDLCSDLSAVILERQRSGRLGEVYEYAYSATSGPVHQVGTVWAADEVEACSKVRARMHDAGAMFPLGTLRLEQQVRGL
jgi:hypothetical protein